MSRNAIGLDISSRRLLAVELSDTGGSKPPTLVKAAAMPLPEGAARDSEVLDIAVVAAALKELWSTAKFSSRRVVLGVGNQRVLVRDHAVPELPANQLRQALRYQVAGLPPVPVGETILDFYPIEPVPESAPPQMRGLLVAALRDSVETDVATLADAGLKVVGVDLSPFAAVRALRLGDALEGTQTIVSIGPRTTHIVVVRDGVPQFVRIVPVGGENVTDAVLETASLSREDAEKLKNKIGLGYGEDERFAAMTRRMLEALNGIFAAIRSTNSYYLGNYSGAEISRLVLLGAETRLPGFTEALSEHAGLPAALGDPLAGLRVSSSMKPELLGQLEADLAIPVGLAMGGR